MQLFLSLKKIILKNYLNINECLNFSCDLFSLVRGVKNRASLNRIKDFLMKQANNREKSMKLKELILIIIYQLQ